MGRFRSAVVLRVCAVAVACGEPTEPPHIVEMPAGYVGSLPPLVVALPEWGDVTARILLGIEDQAQADRLRRSIDAAHDAIAQGDERTATRELVRARSEVESVDVHPINRALLVRALDRMEEAVSGRSVERE